MGKQWDNPIKRVAPEGARVPASYEVGGIRIAPATLLAPMAGVTDTVFRRFIREMDGCGLMMTEFTSADGVLRSERQESKTLPSLLRGRAPDRRTTVRSNPETLREAATMIEGLGFDMVDLNLGCPAKKVVKCNGGSGLLRDLPLIGKIFETVRSAVKIPFTVKFRAGWSEKELVFLELAKLAESCGLTRWRCTREHVNKVIAAMRTGTGFAT